MKRLSRRQMLRGLGIASLSVAGASALGACAPSAAPAATEAPAEEKATEVPTPAPKPAEAVTIYWWTGWSAETLGEVAAAFSEEVPEITVEWLGSVDQEKFLTSAAGGTPPDAATLGAYPELFSRKVAMALTEWVNTSAAFKKDDIFEASWNGGTFEGEIYGLPCVEGFVRYGLCYNVDLVKEAGLDPDSPPETWDDTYAWHETITTFDDAGNVTIVGLDPLDAMGGSIGFGDPFMWPKSMGFDYYDQEAHTFNIDNPKMVEALEIIQRFYALVGPEKMAAFRQSYGTWTGPQAGFTSGVQAMQINGYWTPGSMAHNAPDRTFAYSWTPVPEDRRGIKMQSMGGHYVFIPVGSPHPKEAFRFGEFLMTDKACDIIYDGLGWLPARRSYVEVVDTSKYPGLDWFVASALEADELTEVEMDPITGITSVEFEKATDAVIYGEKAPAQAAADMQAKLTEELAKMLEER